MAATRGRELRLELVTDTRRFEADQAARDLDDLADAASDATREIEDIADAGDDLRGLSQDADRAGRSMRDMGQDAERAGREVEGSMGEIRESGRAAAGGIAGGFDGSFESIAGGAQGLVGELAATLGPAAMGPLLAGALAIGAAMAGASAEKERYQEQLSTLLDTYKELGNLGTQIDLPRLKDFTDGLDVAALNRLRDDADKLGISVQTMAEAWAGDADAVAEVQQATDAYYDSLGGLAQVGQEVDTFFGIQSDSWLASSDKLSSETIKLADATREASDAVDAQTEALGGLTVAQQELNTAVAESAAGIVTSSDDITQAMAAIPGGVLAASQAAADASADLSDTWADNVANIGAAADEIIAQQRADIDATKQYYADLETAYAAGGTDLVNYILNSESPADTAKLVAQMSPEDQAEVAANYAELGDLSSAALIKAQNAGLDKAAADAKTKGTAAGKAYSDGVAAGITGNAGKISSAAKAANPSGGSTGASYWANTSGKKVP